MGAVLSILNTLGIAIKVLLQANKDLQEVLQRASQAPGLPNPKPTASYWLEDPPYPELVDAQSPVLPETADIVIIGSGITGAAVAWSILQQFAPSSPGTTDGADYDDKQQQKDHQSRPPRIVVLEARSLCSGATGRNGGHIKPSPHETFADLKGRLGPARAAELVRFQLKHVEMLPKLCASQQWDAAECRHVKTSDMYIDEKHRDGSFSQVRELRNWVPECKIDCLHEEEAQKTLGVNSFIKGAITYTAGALWPFRFVSCVWKSLLEDFPDHISLETHAPVTSIATTASSSSGHAYQVGTPRGIIKCRHVVHATNAFAGQYIPGFRGKITGALAHMTAQRPGTKFPQSDGSQSWSLVYGNAFDYTTQRPQGPDGSAGDIMHGGGLNRGANEGMSAFGVWDDSITDPLPMAHLGGVLPTIFEPSWGPDAPEGRIKKSWTGIVAATGDWLPFVGRLDPTLTGRSPLSSDSTSHSSSGAGPGYSGVPPGEWVSAGYCGDGMVWAWLCGTALGLMISGAELRELAEAPGRPGGRVVDWFPHELLATPARVKKAGLEGLAERFA
ncbi:FAD dependent oxidoreductase-domain-containing protein [Microdochium trichocladiopsis]|uniref:FAD dependent oxidoreductase-domain-containing protein n=1 Tax=Microdochium trichocladiopsis TaxID=1682393 RepID=A0A9P8XZ10_9PEZI|nr:FAD dependent oxidoreductase-domain-containing protein [Microdochium trichocladiopsis]KAH7021158.1 FAD dependent oxidoreductase-domain-containing protein [Microdochium trichocladiopsis]